MNVMRGSEEHVKAVMLQCRAAQCGPLGLALLDDAGDDPGHRGSDSKHAAQRLGISEFYARRINQLWRDDQAAAAVQVSLMVGLFP